MTEGDYTFWLGRVGEPTGLGSADAPEPVKPSPSFGCHPSRWFFRQYGYEKFSIYDERGTEIGFVHRRRDAERIATEWTA